MWTNIKYWLIDWHTSTQLNPTPCLHILTMTQICTPWWTHTSTYICTQICIHWHRQTLNWTHTHNFSLSLPCSTMILECTLALFNFTFCLHWTEYTRKLEKEKRRYETEACNQKLKLTLSDWAHYKPILVSSLFYPLHFVCLFSHSPYYFSPPTTALHKHEKGSCPASEISLPEAETHTQVLSL